VRAAVRYVRLQLAESRSFELTSSLAQTPAAIQ
jgi:hypothetical protein